MTTCARQARVGTPRDSPFDLDNDAAYQQWREWKLARYPLRAAGLVVEIGEPRALTHAEHETVIERCRDTNFAIYASKARDADKDIPRLLGRQFGLTHLDGNWLADDDGISSLTVSGAGERRDYIPYTNRPIKWHTDGYYNAPDRCIRAMVLHCVSDAAAGGENALMDHEIAYLLLRDADPEWVRALMAPDAMTIPARTDEEGVARAERTGPVFRVDPGSGELHMRYTARTRSIAWKQDAATRSAIALLESVLTADSPYIVRATLRPGMGIIANNVLHDRAGFRDDADHQRLLYRARYYDRIAGTESASVRAGVRNSSIVARRVVGRP
jgi:alpha-ketoglutarate-dependent taurine dioxygenase